MCGRKSADLACHTVAMKLHEYPYLYHWDCASMHVLTFALEQGRASTTPVIHENHTPMHTVAYTLHMYMYNITC